MQARRARVGSAKGSGRRCLRWTAARGARALSWRVWHQDPSATEGHGRPFAFVLSDGERHKAAYFDELMRAGAVKRSGPGRPVIRPAQVVGDTGYSYNRIRRDLRRRGGRAVVPHRKNQPSCSAFDAVTYRERNRVGEAAIFFMEN